MLLQLTITHDAFLHFISKSQPKEALLSCHFLTGRIIPIGSTDGLNEACLNSYLMASQSSSFRSPGMTPPMHAAVVPSTSEKMGTSHQLEALTTLLEKTWKSEKLWRQILLHHCAFVLRLEVREWFLLYFRQNSMTLKTFYDISSFIWHCRQNLVLAFLWQEGDQEHKLDRTLVAWWGECSQANFRGFFGVLQSWRDDSKLSL